MGRRRRREKNPEKSAGRRPIVEMKNSEKDRDTGKARRRAKNDARTAIRKLSAWADEIGATVDGKALRIMGARIADTADRLQKKSEDS